MEIGEREKVDKKTHRSMGMKRGGAGKEKIWPRSKRWISRHGGNERNWQNIRDVKRFSH
jgi:hypothetical protein